MTNFKTLFKTQINDSVFVETFCLKRADFVKLGIFPPQSGKGFLITCSDTKLFHSLVLLDDTEEKAKQSHESTVIMVNKNLKKG